MIPDATRYEIRSIIPSRFKSQSAVPNAKILLIENKVRSNMMSENVSLKYFSTDFFHEVIFSRRPFINGFILLASIVVGTAPVTSSSVIF